MNKIFLKCAIDENSYEPKYVQLEKIIRNLILSKKLSPGDEIPSENELKKIYAVSSAVVVRSLRELVNEGFLYRVQGKGTFVAKQSEGNHNNSQLNEKLVGLIIPFDLTRDMLFRDIITGLEKVLFSKGYHLLISNSHNSPVHESECIYKMKRAGVRGLVLFLTEKIQEWEVIKNNVLRMKKEHFPFVLVDRYLQDIETDYVTTDSFLGAYEATEHLIKLGHKKIFHITCSDWMHHTSEIDRLRGYKKAMINHGLAGDQVLETELIKTVERVNPDCETVLKILLKKGPLPIGFFCSEAHITINLVAAIKKAGLRIPEDIAVAGFDILEKNLLANIPGLVTVIQPMEEIGKRAAQVLIGKINLGGTSEIEQFKLKPALVVNQPSYAGKVLETISARSTRDIQ